MATRQRKTIITLINPNFHPHIAGEFSEEVKVGKFSYLKNARAVDTSVGLGFLIKGIPLVVKKSGKVDWKTFHLYVNSDTPVGAQARRVTTKAEFWGLVEHCLSSSYFQVLGGVTDMATFDEQKCLFLAELI